MQFTEDDIRRIKEAAEDRLLDVISDFDALALRKSGKDYVGDCPCCHAKGKFSVSPSKGIFKCWSCNELKGNNALSFLMKGMNMSYVDALDHLARRFNVILDVQTEQPKKPKQPAKMKKGSKAAKGNDVDTFCARMLAASGLTYADVTAKKFIQTENQAIFEGPTFRPGTIDQYGNIVDGDDAIIEYYDIEGNPVTYVSRYEGKSKRTAATAPKEYYRVRWQFPDEHLDKEGNSFKYKSPAGSGTPIYIPERLRKMYKEGVTIPRLYIQEGEKKAEKACKHGIPSIAVSGIQNLGHQGALPADFIKILERCQVREVAFIFDSDWNDLSRDIKINKAVDTRPRCFFGAAKNFMKYMRQLKNRNLNVDAIIGHINENVAGDKGLDDLLANTLKGHEDELAADFEKAANEHSGLGTYVTLYRISTWSEYKLSELWSLQTPNDFAKAHKKILEELPEFRIGRYQWKYVDGKLEPAVAYSEDEKFWIEYAKTKPNGEQVLDVNGEPAYVTNYDYVNGKRFFENRGVGRYRLLNDECDFIRLDAPFVTKIGVEDARDIMFSFAAQYCNKRVNNMLLKGGAQYVGPFQMQRLELIQPNFKPASRDTQFFYLKDGYWEITESSVFAREYTSLQHHIWSDQRTHFAAQYIGHRIIDFKETDGKFSYTFSEEGKKCHFLRFLENTSNFTWRKKAEFITEDDLSENALHLLSKLCAIGFMMMNFKDPNVSRAIIAMDGKQSEVGESNGRSGKSLIGELMRHVEPIVYVSGKKQDFFNDNFIWNDVDERTRLVFIDDVLQGFNFEFLFANITGDWSVNRKGGVRITYPFEESPKIYIATNHAIKGSGSSFTDRQWLIAFSDFYNEGHKPLDDFGLMFFSEWEYEQWNLVWNMLATCVQLYLQYGVVQAPGDRLEQRKRRQEIGETLIAWGDEYFSADNHLNTRIPRKDLWDSFKQYDPQQQKYISPTAFKKKLRAYIEWKGWIYNPNRYDSISGEPLYYDSDNRPIMDDKSGGIEYITVGTVKGASPIPNPDDPLGAADAPVKIEL